MQNNVKIWLKLADPKTWMASVLPVLFGSALSFYGYNRFNGLYFMSILIAMICIQSGTNMFNDYADYKRNADTDERSDEKALASGEMSLKKLRYWMVGTFGLAIVIGVLVAATSSWWILSVAAVGALVLYAYSSGPYPICYTPFGEIIAGITMGIGITATVEFLNVGTFSWSFIGHAIPTAIFVGLLLLSNNLGDWQEDLVNGRKTLPIILGAKHATSLWLIGAIMMLVITVVFVVNGTYPVAGIILTILAFPYQGVRKYMNIEKKRTAKPVLMKLTTVLGIRYHLAMVVALLGTKLFHAIGKFYF